MGTHTVLYSYEDMTTNCTQYDSLIFVVDCTLGIAENETASISLYPNPANESVSLDLGAMNSKKAVIRVYDASGRLMLTQSSDGNAVQKIDVSQLGNGTYMLHIDGETSARKLFVVSK